MMRDIIKKVLKTVSLILIFLLVLTQAGCWNAIELNDLAIVMGIGMDVDTDNSDNIKLIAQFILPDKINQAGSGSSSGSSEKVYLNLTSTAENTHDAMKEYSHMNIQNYLAHNQVFVISRQVAEKGIGQYMDFFVRSKDIRPTTMIVISDTTAEELLNAEPKRALLPAISIRKLNEAQVANSQSIEINVQDYTSTMQSKTKSFVAPMSHIVQQAEDPTISIKGMAVFKKDKMVGELDEIESRGLLWIIGKVKNGAINIEVDGQKVSTEILSTQTKLSPNIKDGKLIINVKIAVDAALTCQTGSENMNTEENIEKINSLIEDVIFNEIISALNKANELDVDIFGFGEEFHKYYMTEWKTLEKDWDTIFPTIDVILEAKVNIRGSGLIVKPVTDQSKEEK